MKVDPQKLSSSLQDADVRRWAAGLGGLAVLGWAVRQRRWWSVPAAAAATPLLYRSLYDRWPVARHAVPFEVEVTLSVHRPAAEVYRFWRQLENLPLFMRHLESVEDRGDGTSRWVARTPGPAGLPLDLSWHAEIVEEQEGRLLSWRSLPGSRVHNAGSVLFTPAPGDRGTTVRMWMEIGPPGGDAARALAPFFETLTEHQVREDLRRFKNLVEADEIPTIESQPTGPRSSWAPSNPL